MIKENLNVFNKANIPMWQELTNYGEGVSVAVFDDGGIPFKYQNAIMPIGNMRDDEWHGRNVGGVIHEIGKNIKQYHFNAFSYIDKAVEWVLNNRDKIDAVNCSWVSPESYAEKLKPIYEAGIPIICGAGNDGAKGVRYPAKFEWTISVGAWEENLDKKAWYSSTGEELNVVGYTDIYFPTDKGNLYRFGGTSCATPFITGMYLLYASWLKKSGIRLTPNEVKEFICSSVRDLKEEGFDILSGHGLFILPTETPKIKKEVVAMFKDIENHWAKEDIVLLVERGELKGFPDGTVRPDEPLTRAQFAHIRAEQIREEEKK